MTVQENYVHRIQQGATIPSAKAIYAKGWIEAIADADSRRGYDPLGLITVEDVMESYLHDIQEIDPAVTKLVDPIDLYAWIAQEEYLDRWADGVFRLFDPYDYQLYRVYAETGDPLLSLTSEVQPCQ